MICLTEIKILATGSWQARGQLSPDERAAHRDKATEHPHAKNQERRVHAVRYLGRIGENSSADDAAHHNHDGVE